MRYWLVLVASGDGAWSAAGPSAQRAALAVNIVFATIPILRIVWLLLKIIWL